MCLCLASHRLKLHFVYFARKLRNCDSLLAKTSPYFPFPFSPIFPHNFLFLEPASSWIFPASHSRAWGSKRSGFSLVSRSSLSTLWIVYPSRKMPPPIFQVHLVSVRSRKYASLVVLKIDLLVSAPPRALLLLRRLDGLIQNGSPTHNARAWNTPLNIFFRDFWGENARSRGTSGYIYPGKRAARHEGWRSPGIVSRIIKVVRRISIYRVFYVEFIGNREKRKNAECLLWSAEVWSIDSWDNI